MKKLLSLLSISFLLSHSIYTLTQEEANKIAVDAYIYAYPLVTMELTKDVLTSSSSHVPYAAPINQFGNLKEFPSPNDKAVTAPNSDTLYSTAWLDLSKEPLVLHVPNEDDRYYLLPILDAWTNVFTVIGTRTTGTQEGNFLITGPDWKGTAPSGMTVLRSPTNIAWIIGRTYTKGTPRDYNIVNEIQSQYTLTPLSHFDKPNSSSTTITNNTNVDTTTPVRDQVNNLNGEQFFKKFSAALKKNPPAAADGPIVSQLAQIGIIPGQEFDINKLDPTIVQAINEAPKQGLKAILKGKDTIAKNVNGWDFFSNVGTYGTNYLDRAVIAFLGLGANLSQDAIYPSAMVDSEGQPLVGTNLYRIHFEKDKLPPVKGFWSLTLYGPDFFFVPNDLKRYSISPRDHLVNNEDGSVDLYIQNESPGKDKESNWLPAPKGPFVLMFRFYWPEQQLIDGDWKIPPVQKVK